MKLKLNTTLTLQTFSFERSAFLQRFLKSVDECNRNYVPYTQMDSDRCA